MSCISLKKKLKYRSTKNSGGMLCNQSNVLIQINNSFSTIVSFCLTLKSKTKTPNVEL